MFSICNHLECLHRGARCPSEWNQIKTTWLNWSYNIRNKQKILSNKLYLLISSFYLYPSAFIGSTNYTNFSNQKIGSLLYTLAKRFYMKIFRWLCCLSSPYKHIDAQTRKGQVKLQLTLLDFNTRVLPKRKGKKE